MEIRGMCLCMCVCVFWWYVYLYLLCYVCCYFYVYLYYLLRLKTQLQSLFLFLLLLPSKKLFVCRKDTQNHNLHFTGRRKDTSQSPVYKKKCVTEHLAPRSLLIFIQFRLRRYLMHKPWHWTVPSARWNLNFSPPLKLDLSQYYPQIHV